MLLFLFLFVFISFAGYAQSVSREQAKQIAIDFVQEEANSLRSSKQVSLDLIYECQDTCRSKSLRSDSPSLFYIFNLNGQEGFVIVSGDERTPEILGYSFESDFVVEGMPDNIQYWLDTYRDQIIDIRKINPESVPVNEDTVPATYPVFIDTLNHDSGMLLEETVGSDSELSLRASYASSVSPLVKTKWNQDSPYNNLCPLDGGKRSVTGCVATALAQIMKYHEWPKKGTGSRTYTTRTKKLSVSANFGTTTYDWNNMRNTYSSSYSTTEANAVATLMKHAGVASLMDYTNRESAAYDSDAGYGLINYLGYNPNMQMYMRDYCSNTTWRNLLKEQLNAKLPLYYTGQGKDGGHAFVCDGYDSRDLFHINWGWGGANDGYFQIDLMNPSSPGIGGGSGGYSKSQSVFCDVRKPYSGSKATYILNLSPDNNTKTIWTTTKTISKNSTFNVHIQYYNYGLNKFDGKVCVAIKLSDSKVSVLKSFDVSLDPNWGHPDLNFKDLKVPTDLKDGKYKIYALYKHKSASSWSYMGVKQGCDEYLTLKVSGNNVYLGTQGDDDDDEEEETFSLSVTNKVQATGKIIQNKTASFSATLKNVGKGSYSGKLGVYMVSSSDSKKTQLIMSSFDYYMGAGSSKSYTVSGKVTLAPGSYMVYPAYEQNGKTYYIDSGTKITIESEKEDIKLAVEKVIYSYDKRIEKGEKVMFFGEVKNTGKADYKDYLGLYLVNKLDNKQNQLITTTFERSVFAGKSSLFSVEDIIRVIPGTYYAYITYMEDGKTAYLKNPYSTITVYDVTTGNDRVDSNDFFRIYMERNTETLFIKGKSIKQIQLYSLSGSLVFSSGYKEESEIQVPMDKYPTGYYVVVVQTKDGVYSQKIIK